MKKEEQIRYRIARSKSRIEARNKYKATTRITSGKKPKVKGENTCLEWDDPKLQEKRAKRRAHLKALAKAKKDAFKLQAPNYSQFNKNSREITAQAKFNIMIIHMKQSKALSIKQSKEDKAKYKTSLVAFKKTYVRKTDTTKAPLAA